MSRVSMAAPGIRWFLACLVVTIGLSVAACAIPYFMIGSHSEWSEALLPTGEIKPMTEPEWYDYMYHWAMHLAPGGDPYPTNTFLPPELYPWGGGGGGGLDPEDPGLVMAWGDETTPSGPHDVSRLSKSERKQLRRQQRRARLG